MLTGYICQNERGHTETSLFTEVSSPSSEFLSFYLVTLFCCKDSVSYDR